MIIPQPTEQNPITVENYPYGFRLRTQAQYWIETTKNGQRVVFRTRNPKTGKWNKPKKSTYSDIRILFRNPDNGHIENDGLSFTYSDQADLDKFLKQFPEKHFSDYQKEQLRIFRAILKTRKHVSISVVENPTPKEAQRIEENNKQTQKDLHSVFQHYLTEQ